MYFSKTNRSENQNTNIKTATIYVSKIKTAQI